MKVYLQWVVGQRKWVILTSMLLTVFFAHQLKNLTVLIDPDKSVPQTHPLIVATNRIEALFGNKFTAVIVVTPTQGDAFQQVAAHADGDEERPNRPFYDDHDRALQDECRSPG